MVTKSFDLFLPGRITRGHQVASGSHPDYPYPGGTLRQQMPHFAERGLDLGGFHAGTINVDVAPRSFRLIEGDHTFREVRWTDRIPPEDFSFGECAIEFQGSRYPALIYWSHPETKTENYQSPSIAEILTEKIEGIMPGLPCVLHVHSSQVESSELPATHPGLGTDLPGSLMMRLRRKWNATHSTLLFSQPGSGERCPGVTIELMHDMGLRFGLRFNRPGEWPAHQLSNAEKHRQLTARLPYWRQSGNIAEGRLFLSLPGDLCQPGKWLNIGLTIDPIRVALYLDGVLIDEEWPYGTLDVTSPQIRQHNHMIEIATDGWEFHPRLMTQETMVKWSGQFAATAEQLLGPEEPFGNYWRPRGINTSAGDVMVCFDGERLHVLTLSDRRNHGSRWQCAACEFNHRSTTDLKHWALHPDPLSLTCAEETAIGTGGMLYHGGTYHVWGNILSPRLGKPATDIAPPRIVHATSQDGIHFERETAAWMEGCEPGIYFDETTEMFHLIKAAQRFESRDLRDWKLVDPDYLPSAAQVTGYRIASGKAGKDAPTDECYTVFRWNDWFYILGGRTGFWMAKSIEGPFWEGEGDCFRPRWDLYDGAMVPQATVVWENRCLLVGWVLDHWWGGRLVFRELQQMEDGTLALGWVKELMPRMGEAMRLTPIQGESNSLVAEQGQFSYISFPLLGGDQHLEFTLRPGAGCGAFGINLRGADGYRGGRELSFVPSKNEARWSTPCDGRRGVPRDLPRTQASDYALPDVEGLEGEVKVRIILRDFVVDTWINGQRTMLTRSHDATGDRLFLFVESGSLEFDLPMASPLLSPS